MAFSFSVPARPAPFKEWAIQDFKSLDHVSCDLNKLVVLTGPNSSGKSSYIQSLLMFVQSQDDEVVLNGPLVRLGEPTDVIRNGCSELTASYSVHDDTDAAEAEWSFEMTLAPNGADLRVTSFHAAKDGEPMLSATSKRVTVGAISEVNPAGTYGNTLLRVTEIAGKSAPARTYIGFSGVHPDTLLFRQRKSDILRTLRRNYGKKQLLVERHLILELFNDIRALDSRQGRNPALTEVRRMLDSFLESDTDYVSNISGKAYDSLLDKIADVAAEDDWRPLAVGRQSAVFSPRFRATANRFSGLFGWLENYRTAIRGVRVAADALLYAQRSVQYLGPLREEPQVVSALGGRYRNIPVGIRGEFTADLLARRQDRPVRFQDPTPTVRSSTLREAISVWTQHLGIGDAVSVKDLGKLGRGLRLSVNGAERDLTTIGVGASQLLPVIALVLAADPGSVLLLEQPELHLHPAVQSRLADFFCWARPDVSLIVETHSEYLITRIRRRAAERSIPADAVTVMFAEQQSGTTMFRHLALDSLGNFNVWPDGFFDTQDRESRALVRAVSQTLGASDQ